MHGSFGDDSREPAGYRSASRSTSAKGIPGVHDARLPDESCREARDRVRAAIISSGHAWPEKKITVNLAPPTYPQDRLRSRPGDRGRGAGRRSRSCPADAWPRTRASSASSASTARSGACPAWRRWSASTPTPTGSCPSKRGQRGRGRRSRRDPPRRQARPPGRGAHRRRTRGPSSTSRRSARAGPHATSSSHDLADVRGQPHARLGARGRRRRRSPPAVRRAARRRQDDARPAPPGLAARPRSGDRHWRRR